MNYLAHSYLSCGDEDLLLGNLVTDLIRKKDETAYSQSIRKGIDLHRKIDTYTDQHPIVHDTLPLIYPTQGKYASVVLDILWDYYLSINWKNFSGEELGEFTNNVYSILEKNYHQIQDKIVVRFESMIAHNFLLSCSTEAALQSTFTHLQKRAKFKANFDKVGEILEAHHDELNDAFMKMLPEMISYVELNCQC